MTSQANPMQDNNIPAKPIQYNTIRHETIALQDKTKPRQDNTIRDQYHNETRPSNNEAIQDQDKTTQHNTIQHKTIPDPTMQEQDTT